MNWEETALEYKKEIETLQKEVEEALYVLEQKGPRTFDRAFHMLVNAIEKSNENFLLIKLCESSIIRNKDKSASVKHKATDDCFSNIL